MPDDLNPRQMWELINKLEDLGKKLDKTDSRVEGIVQVLDGIGQQAGIRQQLRELKHAVEGNPPAMKGVVLELITINESHHSLRREFEKFVDEQNKVNAARQGAWGGAKFVWGLIVGALAFLGGLAYLLNEIQTALSRGGG